MTYRNMREVRKANKDAGRHFFDKDTMRFFDSRVETELIDGRYFVTSEQYRAPEGTPFADDVDGPRLYTIREVGDDADIDTVGEFQQYTDIAAATAAANHLEVK